MKFFVCINQQQERATIKKKCPVCRKFFDKTTPRQTYCCTGCSYRAANIKKRYGITSDVVHELYKNQKGRCKICKKSGDVYELGFVKRSKQLVVDHCHTKGHVRGLLCNFCNKGLGLFRDDPDALREAIKYLKNTRGKKK